MTDEIKKLIEEATTDINIVANIVIPQMPAFGLEASSTAVQSVVDAARNLASTLSAVAGEMDRMREAVLAILKVSEGTWIQDVHKMRDIAQSVINQEKR